MLKKFTDGLMFGAGFAISFLIIWYLGAYYISPLIVDSRIQSITDDNLAYREMKRHGSSGENEAISHPKVQFHELTLDEQIKKASVIALAKYEQAPDGKMKAIITEFLKKDPGVTIYYKVGDEYPSSSYYPKANEDRGDGLVIFFVGSPASMRMSMTFSGDRIRGLGDLPIELFRKKCE
jgi:hypothetical protein